MNWMRIVLGGVLAGVATNIADFVMHGMILAKTYQKYPEAFSQTPANPLHFAAISVVMGICIAIFFAKSRSAWEAGWKGGATFGLFFGIAIFFSGFYMPLVIGGFPYYLAWCWGGTYLVDALVGGVVLGAVIPRD